MAKQHKLGKRSRQKLVGVHPELVDVVERALELFPYDFGVTHGVRTIEEQTLLLKMRKSLTMRSRHLTGHAVDLAVYVKGELTWDLKYYVLLKDSMFKAAQEKQVHIEWGGFWSSIIDGVHFQLSRKSYPSHA